ncbi:hypothetical protein [Luteolibacter soli]|uniref:Uncharacterized protein n=1 Tax=Luteolibacter soli TaxID=3135280 RepID=A0ABU9AUX7_9BACT
MKILAVIEFSPGTGPKKRGSFSTAMADSGFTRLPGVSSCWIADRKFSAVDPAREALAQVAATTEVRVHKAYLVEYGEFLTFPPTPARRA